MSSAAYASPRQPIGMLPGIAQFFPRYESLIVGDINSDPNLSNQPSLRADTSVVEHYNMLFRTVRADTPELRREVFRLRYQVYCVEQNFLEAEHYPDGLEIDECDRHSQHALLLHRNSNAPVGTARLVLPKLGSVSGTLPIFKVCPKMADYVPVNETAETSRFAVSKEFRRRVSDGLYGRILDKNDADLDPRRIIPHISLGLIATSFQMALAEGSDYVCAVMEPTLLRLIARFGIEFVPVGPLIEYHGKRQPCYARLDEMMSNIEDKNYDLWEMITNKRQGRANSNRGSQSDGVALNL